MTTTGAVLVILGLGLLASGGALLWKRAALVSASFQLAAGVGLVVAGILDGQRSDAAVPVGNGAAALGVALAAATYPSLRWRHPVDLVGLSVLTGCGVVATGWPGEGGEIAGLAGGCALLAYVWWRIETSSGRERRATTLAAGAMAASSIAFWLLTFATEQFADNDVVSVTFLLVFLVVPAAMYVGATLPDLVDVRALVVSGVVLVVAVITYLALFVLLMSLLEAAGAGSPSVGTTALVGAIVAVTFAPTQSLLRGVVEELLFGVRLDPLGAASAVAASVGDDPVRALQSIRESLNLPYAAVLVADEVVASSGTGDGHDHVLDLGDGARLVVGLRPGDQRLTGADEQVLGLTAPLLAQALRARALAAEVVASRGRTISAVEEERRRLRRDLHDGLGPRLSGVAFTSDAARNLVRSDPAAAEEMLVQLRADTSTAIEEIRRMVYAMRPPALDELGLVPALRQQAVGLRNKDGRPVSVSVRADELPDLPAAVEVAAYRIVTEALANVARHSTSPTADVRIDATGDALRLEVSDTGRSDGWRPGVGMSSMRERATELGGTLEAGPGPSGGKVAALLPL